MLNQAALEALYSATYVDNFLDTIENLPDEVQRHISHIRELDIKYQALLEDLENLKSQYMKENDPHAVKRVIVHMEDKLILSQEIGDEKLQTGQHILDIIENRHRQLDLDCKNLDLEQEEKSDTGKDTPCDRSSKRPRRSKVDNNHHSHNENSNDMPATPCADKSGSGMVRNVANKTSSQKKSNKKKKRKSRTEREREDSPTEISIDPNEPTYCLCEQVSYGEMIGCDNDLCPIEWFHFSCVNLTNKPKGKWFCPKCRGDKPTIMKPRAQFLKELQKYNKEKEERS